MLLSLFEKFPNHMSIPTEPKEGSSSLSCPCSESLDVPCPRYPTKDHIQVHGIIRKARKTAVSQMFGANEQDFPKLGFS